MCPSGQVKVKMPPKRRFVRKLPDKPDEGRPEWEGMGCLIVRVRDLSLKEDADVWEEMAKVTSQSHRQAIEVELTDVSTQADLIPGNAVGDIGFTSGGGFFRGKRDAPKKAPNPLGGTPPVNEPIASSLNFTTRIFVGDTEVITSAADTMREEAPPSKMDVRLTSLVSGSAK